ncbi:MAG: DUF6263 family protein [Candidatus Hydrogenedentales bacterium]
MRRLFACFVLFLSACSEEPVEVAPQLHWQPGDRWAIRETVTSELAVPDAGQMMRFQARETIDWLLEVDTGTAAGGWDATLTWENTTRNPGLSWDKAVDMVTAGKQIQFHVSPRGEVSAVRGLEPLHEPVAEAIAADEQLNESGGTRDVQQFYEKALSEAGMVGHLERVFRVFPPGPVMTGDEWLLPAIALPHQDFQITRTCSATVASEEVIDIVFRGDIKDLMTEPDSLQHGEETGTARFNRETGQLQEVLRRLSVKADSSAGRSEYTETSNVIFTKQ